MKLIIKALIYYLQALFYVFGVKLIMKMKHSSSFAAFLTRYFERFGEKLYLSELMLKNALK